MLRKFPNVRNIKVCCRNPVLLIVCRFSAACIFLGNIPLPFIFSNACRLGALFVPARTPLLRPVSGRGTVCKLFFCPGSFPGRTVKYCSKG